MGYDHEQEPQLPQNPQLLSIGLTLLDLLLGGLGSDAEENLPSPADTNFIETADSYGNLREIVQRFVIERQNGEKVEFDVTITPDTHSRVFEFVKNGFTSCGTHPSSSNTVNSISELSHFEAGGISGGTLSGRASVVVTPTQGG